MASQGNTTTTRSKYGETDLNKSNVICCCEICSDEVSNEDKAIQCELCLTWNHHKCVSITDKQYKFMKDEHLHWYCDKCNPIATDIVKSLAALKSTQVRLEDAVSKFKATLKTELTDELTVSVNNNTVTDIKKTLKTEILTENKPVISQMVEQKVANVKSELLAELKTDITKLVKAEVEVVTQSLPAGNATLDADSVETIKSTVKSQAFDEIKETIKETVTKEQQTLLKTYAQSAANNLKLPSESQIRSIVKLDVKEENAELERIKRRQNNLIIHNLPESVEPDEDIAKFKEIVKDILHIREPEIEAYTRLGTRNDEKPRLLRVSLKQMSERKEILARAPQLRQVDEDDVYARVYIRPDLTPKQLEASKNLYMKLKEVREQNKDTGKKFKILKGEIVPVEDY